MISDQASFPSTHKLRTAALSLIILSRCVSCFHCLNDNFLLSDIQLVAFPLYMQLYRHKAKSTWIHQLKEMACLLGFDTDNLSRLYMVYFEADSWKIHFDFLLSRIYIVPLLMKLVENRTIFV